ncbi:SET domain-containing protein [Phytophthora infestans]|uniref:SET domain-containing protein n=1 Tax=Phytophthora infestans TaxID=4787 RepID=A0A8S9TT25_PHYIN|nr:SET domain-containing protein [Phytophthora infestans]
MNEAADVDVETRPWKALKSSALSSAKSSGLRAARPDCKLSDLLLAGHILGHHSNLRVCPVNRYSSVAAPYGPADPVASTYFQVVISKAKAPIVCGDAGPVKGKAIYADRDLPKATRIWTESPLVAMQHEINRGLLPCCQFCYLPLLDDAQDQWRDIVTRYNTQVSTKATAKPAGPVGQQQDPAKQGRSSGVVDDDALEKVLKLLRITPQSCGMAGPGAKCSCGELYCSKLCRMRAFHEYHAILCPRNDPCLAMGEFLKHTLHTNDIFLLAAKVIARVLSRYIVWRDIVKAREPIDMFFKKPWWEVVVVEHDDFVAQPSNGESGSDHTSNDSGVCSNNEDRSPSDVKDIDEEEKAEANDGRPTQQTEEEHAHWTSGSSKAQCLQEVLTMTHQLLIDALECNLVRLEREGQLRGVTVEEIWRCCSSVLSFEFFTAQIGLFEMNNISMEVDHPFHAFIDILDPDVQSDLAAGDPEHIDGQISPRLQPQLTTEDQALLGSVRSVLEWEKHRLQAEQAGDEERDADALMWLGYPRIEGTALFPIICTMNHSCDPNCTVMYTKNGDGHVVAIRDIEKGEELCICYIDVDMDVQMRESNLREYKFKCFCSRCVQERQQLDRPNPQEQRTAEERIGPATRSRQTRHVSSAKKNNGQTR